jgi:hypothetical protein
VYGATLKKENPFPTSQCRDVCSEASFATVDTSAVSEYQGLSGVNDNKELVSKGTAQNIARIFQIMLSTVIAAS